MKFIKIPRHENWSSNIQTAYMVEVDGELIGAVWSRKGFSYRGTKGWNRGLRCRDFHPIEWHYGKRVETLNRSVAKRSRRYAAEELLESVSLGNR